MNILGLNAFHGDASAALLRDGQLVAAIEEERLNRIKHWAGLPLAAAKACLQGRTTRPHRDFAQSQGSSEATNYCGQRCGHTGGRTSPPGLLNSVRIAQVGDLLAAEGIVASEVASRYILSNITGLTWPAHSSHRPLRRPPSSPSTASVISAA